jgi:LmbE family N-acetylglucosaminyl deacetylase
MTNILIVAAHPDDEVLGVGGTIAKHVAQGDRVFVCLVTKSHSPKWSEEYRKQKQREAQRVDAILGIRERVWLDFPTARTNVVATEELTDALQKVVDRVVPDRVYTHFAEDVHEDHRHIFRGVLVATRPLPARRMAILSFETPSSTEWSHQTFHPTHYVNIGAHLKTKLKAFGAYRSEVKAPPHPRSLLAIKTLATLRGSQVGWSFAEAFQIVRTFG